MRTRPRSSPGSAPCRLEWRPSRWALLALGVLAALAALAVRLSATPAPWAGMAGFALFAGAACQAARLLRRRSRSVVVPWGGAAASVDGYPVARLKVQWRGPLAWISWRRGPGRRQRLMFWPDTLPPARRRELRLAARSRLVSPAGPGMAP